MFIRYTLYTIHAFTKYTDTDTDTHAIHYTTHTHTLHAYLYTHTPTPTHHHTMATLKVAVTQHEPVWFDLQATVDKTCTLIAEAGANGAKIVAFPEVWITGYPAWIW